MTGGMDVDRVRSALFFAANVSLFGYVGGVWCSLHQVPAASLITQNFLLNFSFFYILRPYFAGKVSLASCFDAGRVRAAVLMAACSLSGYVGGVWSSLHQVPAASFIALNFLLNFSFFYIVRPWRSDLSVRFRRLVGR